MKKSEGFTLLEVLVALGIVAMIAVLSWKGLSEVLRLANRVREVDEQVQVVAAVFSQMEKDLGSLQLGTELMVESAKLQDDGLQVTSNGLQIRFTQRDTSEPVYREHVEWTLTEASLLRKVWSELSPEKSSTSDAIAMQGLRVRFLYEQGGWTSPVFIGNQAVQQPHDELQLQGVPLFLNKSTSAAPMGMVQEGLVRAVEIALTLPTHQTVTRVSLTGGVF